MKAVVQRVSRAEVVVDGRVVGRCGPGYVVLCAAERRDTEEDAIKMADRVAGLRIMGDADGKMNLSLRDLPESELPRVLAISNFTVIGETSKNRRPSFATAAPFEEGRRLFGRFVEEMRSRGLSVDTGLYGAHMEVHLVNDGPVTVILETKPPRSS